MINENLCDFKKVELLIWTLKKQLPWNCLSAAVRVVHNLDSPNLSAKVIFQKF